MLNHTELFTANSKITRQIIIVFELIFSFDSVC